MLDLLRRRSAVIGLLAGLIAASCLLVASTWTTFSHTWDEPEHLAAGLELIDTGHYDYDIQHPPIARTLLAIGPYLAGARSQGLPPPDGKPEGVAILYGEGHYDLFLALARAGVLPFLVLLLWVTYRLARTVTTRAGALTAVAMLATTPTVLGHAGLATIDIAAAASCLWGIWAFREWLLRGRLRDAVLLGLASGVALGVKMSAIPYGGIGGTVVLLLYLLDRRRRVALTEESPRRGRAWGIAIAMVVAAWVLTIAYGGRWIYLTDSMHHFNQAIGFLFGYKSGILRWPAYDLFEHFPVPLAFQWYIGAFQAITVHNDNGHLSYLLGELHQGGWPWFYLLAIAVKTQWPLLAGGLIGGGLVCREALRSGRWLDLSLPLTVVGILWFASGYSHINIGVRHVLIVYPLLAVGAGVTAMKLWQRGQEAGVLRWPALLLLCAGVVGEGVTVISTWPDYLAYFNGFAPHPERILVDSDLDWGQDFKRLTRRLQELRVPSISLAYLGTADLPREPLPPYRLLAPDEPATGWVAVTALARAYAPGHLAWLNAYPVREHIGRTIDLYEIPTPAQPKP
jgi:4-amino-4-deoxy-L-arabinose transferase-like glycosyltransferase